jgi:hypothetical protein
MMDVSSHLTLKASGAFPLDEDQVGWGLLFLLCIGNEYAVEHALKEKRHESWRLCPDCWHSRSDLH